MYSENKPIDKTSPIYKAAAIMILFFGYGLTTTTFVYSNFVSTKQYERDKDADDRNVNHRLDKIENQIDELKNIIIRESKIIQRR